MYFACLLKLTPPKGRLIELQSCKTYPAEKCWHLLFLKMHQFHQKNPRKIEFYNYEKNTIFYPWIFNRKEALRLFSHTGYAVSLPHLIINCLRRISENAQRRGGSPLTPLLRWNYVPMSKPVDSSSQI